VMAPLRAPWPDPGVDARAGRLGGSGERRSCNEPPLLKFARCGFDRILRNLPGEPFRQFLQSPLEIDSGRVTELDSAPAEVGKAMADVARAVLSRYVRREMRHADYAREIACDRKDCVAFARTDVEYVANGLRGFECQETTVRDIGDMHEIAPLPAVLEHKR